MTQVDQSQYLAAFILGLTDPEVAGWREHKEFIEAWNAGLFWFVNYSGGHAVEYAMREYGEYIQRGGYENLPIAEGYTDV